MPDNLFLYIGIGAVLVIGVVVVIFVLRPKPTAVEERLGRYTDAGVLEESFKEDEAKDKPTERTSPIGEILNNLIQSRGLGGGVRSKLQRANIKLNLGEYYAMMVIAIVGGAFIGALLALVPECGTDIGCLIAEGGRGSTIVVSIIGAGLGYIAPGMYLSKQTKGRLKAFNNQLADMLALMVNSLRAGYSIMQSMEAVAKEAPPPVSEEFRRVVQEVQLGLSLPDALDHLLERVRSDDLDLVVTAINVQREVGGNLAEILDTMAFTIRERVRIKGEIMVLTSQGMMTGGVISFMPFALMGILYLINRPFISSFWAPENQPLGFIMLAIAFIMIAAGWGIIQKVVSIEI